jgi:hypothetical protein
MTPRFKVAWCLEEVVEDAGAAAITTPVIAVGATPPIGAVTSQHLGAQVHLAHHVALATITCAAAAFCAGLAPPWCHRANC